MANAGFIGQLGEFVPRKEDYGNYVRRFKIWTKANKIAEGDMVNVFLAIVGAEAFEAVSNHFCPDDPSTKTFKELDEALEVYYGSTKNEIALRLEFRQRRQGPKESIAEYILELKKLARHCGYGAQMETNLRDTFVAGLRDTRTQAKLLSKGNTLTWKMAVDEAVAMESAQADSSRLQQGSIGNHRSSEVHQLEKSQWGNSCYRCLGPHQADRCPHRQATCYACGKMGHIKRACKSKRPVMEKSFQANRSQGKAGAKESSQDRGRGSQVGSSKNRMQNHQSPRKRSQRSNRSTHMIETETENNDNGKASSAELYTVEGEDLDSVPTVEFNISDNVIPFVVDTAAAVSVISEKEYRNSLCHIPLQRSSMKLTGYGRHQIPVLGRIQVRVQYKSSAYYLPLVVVQGDNVALMGRNWLRRVRIDWGELFEVGLSSQTPDLQEVLAQHGNVFKPSGPGDRIREFQAEVKVKEDVQPTFCKARPVPYAQLEVVEKELDRLEKAGMIRKVKNSKWAAPIVVVPKSDGSVRLCGDYKQTVNKVLEEDTYPLPTCEDLFANLAGGKVFSKIDLSNAYLQLELTDKSKELLTIHTHKGLYQYNRLPFGVSTAPAVFQSVMDQVLGGMQSQGVCCYLDDILISSRNEEEHVQTLNEVLKRLGEYGIKAKKEKCSFMVPRVVYLGHEIDGNGVHPTKEKIEGISEAKRPENVDELRTFIGIITYYAKFIPNLASTFAPLYRLLRDDVDWEWTMDCQNAFDMVKQVLSSDAVLAHYNPKKPLVLACDASPYGLGVVLSHIMEDGTERPVAYASRTLTNSEQNYSQVEKESLAIIFGVTKFHKYLYGRKFTLLTDHQALTTIFGSKKGIPSLAASRLQRWALILMAHQYDIKYRKSADHANADVLSRFPVKKESKLATELPVNYFTYTNSMPVSAKEISEETRKDVVLSKVLHYVRNGWPSHLEDDTLKEFFSRRNELSVDQDCLLWGMRVVIPPKFRDRLLEELHQEHTGVVRMKGVARSYFWYPKLDADIENLVKCCETCLRMRNDPPKVPFVPWSNARRPFERVHIDFFELEGKEYLVLVDTYSKWVNVELMSSTTSAKTIETLRGWFAIFGLPETLVSDNGPQFTSEETEVFLSKNGVKHVLVPPYHPASNGAAERTVQIVKRALQKYFLDDKFGRNCHVSIKHRLDNFLFSYRTTPQTVVGVSPYELVYRFAPRTRFSLLKPDLNARVVEKQQKTKQYHDRPGMKLRQFEAGERVMVKNHRGGKERYVVGVIVKRLGFYAYLVRVSGRLRQCHVDHLLERGPEREEQGERAFDRQKHIEVGTKLTDVPRSDAQNESGSESETSKSTVSQGEMIEGKRNGQGQSEGHDDHQKDSVDNDEHFEERNVRRYPDRRRKKPDRLIENM